MQSTVDGVRPEAEKVALAAATVCAAQYASGRFTVKGGGCALNVLPGEKLVPEIPSPAKGTPLESNASVADVQVMCEAPTSAPGANPTTSCGQGLGSLRGLHEISGNGSGYAEDTCRKNAADCSQIVVPSGYSPAPDAVDLKVVKPVSGGPPGATAVVTLTLVKK
jgi:hypothetical protein